MLFFQEEFGLQLAAVQKCIEFLHSPLFPADGGVAEVEDGIRCSVGRYVTLPEAYASWEAHKQYVDVHCVLSGEEKIRVAHTMQGKIGEYHVERDYLEVEGNTSAEILLRKGSILCLFPNDAHQVKLQVCEGKEVPVTKVIFKVPIELF